MISRDDWNAALDDWSARERERLGGPPTPEEVVAFKRGELSASEAERIRALLVYTPELTELLDEEVAAPQQHVRSWTAFLPIAAAVIVAFLGGLLVSRWTGPAARHGAQIQPSIALEADHARGGRGPEIELAPEEEQYVFAPAIASGKTYREYRIDVLDLRGADARVLSSRKGAPMPFVVTIPRADLEPGAYRIDVYGLDGTRAEFIDGFPFRVAETAR